MLLGSPTSLWPWAGAAPAAAGGRDTPTPSAASGEDSGGGSGDSAGAAARWPADPRALLGRRVRRTFAAGVFEGVVRGTRMLPPDSPERRAPGWASPPEAGAAEPQRIWLVCYPDGDKEELYWSELLPALKEAEKRLRALPAPPAGQAAIVKQEGEAQGPKYKGVSYEATSGKYRVALTIAGCHRVRGAADTALEAARKYDDAVRAAGHVVVNFPRLPGEIQAVAGELEETTLRRAGRLDEARGGGGSAPPADTEAAETVVKPQPAVSVQRLKPLFKGVSYNASTGMYSTHAWHDGRLCSLGNAETAAAAARKYDDSVRARGRVVVNFPRLPGEIQAVHGEQDHLTMQRAGLTEVKAVKPRPQNEPKYKGVKYDFRAGVYRAVMKRFGQYRVLGVADSAAAAARMYDDAVRAVGRVVVNFPQLPGEIQAVAGEAEDITLRRAGLLEAKGGGVSVLAARSAVKPPGPHDLKYKGVTYDASTNAYRAGTSRDGHSVTLGYAGTAAEAARIYDDSVRALCRKHVVVNFPRHGEVQAVHGESESITLRRAGLLGEAKGPGGILPSAKSAKPRPSRDPRGGIMPDARAGGGGVERRSRSGADASPPRKRIKAETPSPTREATPCPPAEWPSPAAATPAAPTPAPPARSAQQQQPVSDASSTSFAVCLFLRRIQPPIKDIERVVAAVPPRMSMAQLLSAVARDTLPADREAAVHCLASILGIDDASDRLQLLIELQAHARRAV